MKHLILGVLFSGWLPVPLAESQGKAPDDGEDLFRPLDVFQLEYASDPRISPSGSKIVYVRTFFDVMKDRRRSNLWIVDADGSEHRPLTTGNRSDSSPRWSPDGKRLLFLSREGGTSQVWLRWMDTGQTAKLTNLQEAPGNLAWSPDGRWIAFSMFVPDPVEPFVRMPKKPAGAEWSEPPKVIRSLRYRADGAGYLPEGRTHLFLLPAEGGTPRRLTRGPWDHDGPLSFTPDGRHLLFSANRQEDAEMDPKNSEIWELALDDGSLRALTDRKGPDRNPVLSPDGGLIAYLGYDDRLQGYQVTGLHLMNRDGTGGRRLSKGLDRDVRSPRWSPDGKGLFFLHDDEGRTRIGFMDLEGGVRTLVEDVGGTSLGRPYPSGSFTVAGNGSIAYTRTDPHSPADLAFWAEKDAGSRRLTFLNEDLLGSKKLGPVGERWFESSYDKRRIQGWLVKPPSFDPSKKYPLILEIHGGPFLNYGPRFSAEIQLYAAAGYAVLYMNPRGSTSYGEEFGNLIHHSYPGRDYDDLLSGVDGVCRLPWIDREQCFVTGGSGGGVLTSWIVGKTDRFKAAVVAKPVINWYSFVLTSDVYNFFYKYWFPGFPWDHTEHYRKRSPISLAGSINTPTMLLTGEEDHRTPISESEQLYQALKLRKVDTALVRIPGASHGISSRPSRLIAKVAHILAWFGKYRRK